MGRRAPGAQGDDLRPVAAAVKLHVVGRWNGADLDHNQDPARQALCDYLDGVGGAAGLFDFPMKGILQARPRPATASAPRRREASIEHPAGSASWAGSAFVLHPSPLQLPAIALSHQLHSLSLCACCRAALPGYWDARAQIDSCRWRQASAALQGRRRCEGRAVHFM